jgi:AraC-like DNA-binding protein
VLVLQKPSPSLAPYVDVLCFFDGGPQSHQKELVLPHGCFQLGINLVTGAGSVSGMSTRASVLDTGQMQPAIGLLFRTGGARPFFDFPAGELLNRTIRLDLAWGSRVTGIRDQLQEASSTAERFRVMEQTLLRVLRPRAARRIELHPAVTYALREFQRAPGVSRIRDVTRAAGLSRRRLAQLFREQVGLTPKLYCRLRRFQRLVCQIARGAPVDWAELAASGGFADQAHMAHEFRDFSGLTPGEYRAAARPSANHVVLE